MPRALGGYWDMAHCGLVRVCWSVLEAVRTIQDYRAAYEINARHSNRRHTDFQTILVILCHLHCPFQHCVPSMFFVILHYMCTPCIIHLCRWRSHQLLTVICYRQPKVYRFIQWLFSRAFLYTQEANGASARRPFAEERANFSADRHNYGEDSYF